MARKPRVVIPPDELHDLYVVQGLSQAQIAARFGCAQRTISAHLSRHGIARPDAEPAVPTGEWDPDRCHPGLPCWEDCRDDPSRACGLYDKHHPQGKRHAALGAPATAAAGAPGPNGDNADRPTPPPEPAAEPAAEPLGPPAAPAPDPLEPKPERPGVQDLDELLDGLPVAAEVQRRLLLDSAFWPFEAEVPSDAAVTYNSAIDDDAGGIVCIRAEDRDAPELLLTGYQVIALWQFLVAEGLIVACLRSRDSHDKDLLSALQGAAQ